MVDMSVGEENRLDKRGGYGKFDILKNISALFHTAVDKEVSATDFQKRATACNFMSSTDKTNFHKFHLCYSIFGCAEL
jgi:hypothetical protein